MSKISSKQDFQILDRKYGDILMVLPQIKGDPEMLKNLPSTMEEVSYNVQEAELYRIGHSDLASWERNLIGLGCVPKSRLGNVPNSAVRNIQSYCVPKN